VTENAYDGPLAEATRRVAGSLPSTRTRKRENSTNGPTNRDLVEEFAASRSARGITPSPRTRDLRKFFLHDRSKEVAREPSPSRGGHPRRVHCQTWSGRSPVAVPHQIAIRDGPVPRSQTPVPDRTSLAPEPPP